MIDTRVLYVIALVIFVFALVAVAAWGCGRRAGGAVRTGGASQPDGVRIEWAAPQECYPAAAIAECLAAARGLAGFGPVSPEERETLAAAASKIGKKHSVNIGVDALVSMRTMEAALASQRAGVLAQRHGDKILAKHRAGVPILEIAKHWRLPPVATLRQVLIELGNSAADVRRLLQEPSSLPGALSSQAAAVFEADLGSRENSDRIQAAATAYEEELGARLRGLGVEFATERDIRAGWNKPGAVQNTLTPDFLLTRPITINGKAVHWIDAKNYPMYGSRLVAKGLSRQAQKYTEAFGPGAFVFSGGVLCGARVPPASPLLLDGSPAGRSKTRP